MVLGPSALAQGNRARGAAGLRLDAQDTSRVGPQGFEQRTKVLEPLALRSAQPTLR